MISFFVPGKPIPQGSAKAFNVGGKARVFTGASNESTPLGGWRARIAEFASREMSMQEDMALRLPRHTGSVQVVAIFYFERPKAIKKLSVRPTSRRCGDIDKLQRSVLDGLAGVVFADDSQVVSIVAAKHYVCDPANFHPMPGVKLEVWFLEES